jgi:hypothetical protein
LNPGFRIQNGIEDKQVQRTFENIQRELLRPRHEITKAWGYTAAHTLGAGANEHMPIDDFVSSNTDIIGVDQGSDEIVCLPVPDGNQWVFELCAWVIIDTFSATTSIDFKWRNITNNRDQGQTYQYTGTNVGNIPIRVLTTTLDVLTDHAFRKTAITAVTPPDVTIVYEINAHVHPDAWVADVLAGFP